ncbi:MAG: hypothetical protein JWO94_3809 [Verrucomicrobiaceae bacterium]|nr:hypothetical protein [Verrucomicrobiaceae bacterium]
MALRRDGKSNGLAGKVRSATNTLPYWLVPTAPSVRSLLTTSNPLPNRRFLGNLTDVALVNMTITMNVPAGTTYVGATGYQLNTYVGPKAMVNASGKNLLIDDDTMRVAVGPSGVPTSDPTLLVPLGVNLSSVVTSITNAGLASVNGGSVLSGLGGSALLDASGGSLTAAGGNLITQDGSGLTSNAVASVGLLGSASIQAADVGGHLITQDGGGLIAAGSGNVLSTGAATWYPMMAAVPLVAVGEPAEPSPRMPMFLTLISAVFLRRLLAIWLPRMDLAFCASAG